VKNVRHKKSNQKKGKKRMGVNKNASGKDMVEST
jgi:hypothetical protein